MSFDATDISSLPTNPMMGGNGNDQPNIVLQQNEKIENKMEELAKMRESDIHQISKGVRFSAPPSQPSHNQMPTALEQNTINSLVSGIQQASISGMTSLPSRDIPKDTTHMMHDEQIKPNYMPEHSPQQRNYIDEEMRISNAIKENIKKQNKLDSADILYGELQIPILIGILYFMFQLPVVKTNLFKFFPSLFFKDGNMKLSGFVFTSVLFSFAFYFIKNTLNYFTTV
jgi:hypothetical protein